MVQLTICRREESLSVLNSVVQSRRNAPDHCINRLLHSVILIVCRMLLVTWKNVIENKLPIEW